MRIFGEEYEILVIGWKRWRVDCLMWIFVEGRRGQAWLREGMEDGGFEREGRFSDLVCYDSMRREAVLIFTL